MIPVLLLAAFPLVAFLMVKLFFGTARGRAFRGNVRKAMGSVEGQPIVDWKAELTLYALEPKGEVGIELLLTMPDEIEMRAVSVSVEEARELASLLEAAAGPGSGAGWIKHPGVLEQVESQTR